MVPFRSIRPPKEAVTRHALDEQKKDE